MSPTAHAGACRGRTTAARRVLFAARRAGAVLNVMQPAAGQSIAVYGDPLESPSTAR
jgi:hypothetical protein